MPVHSPGDTRFIHTGYNSAGDKMYSRNLSGEPAVPVAAYSEEEDVRATQAAQARADELGVDITTVKGTGKNGRITVGDVEDAA